MIFYLSIMTLLLYVLYHVIHYVHLLEQLFLRNVHIYINKISDEKTKMKD